MTKLTIVLTVDPYDDQSHIFVEMFNEWCIWVTVYTLLAFTDAVL